MFDDWLAACNIHTESKTGSRTPLQVFVEGLLQPAGGFGYLSTR